MGRPIFIRASLIEGYNFILRQVDDITILAWDMLTTFKSNFTLVISISRRSLATGSVYVSSLSSILEKYLSLFKTPSISKNIILFIIII